VKITLVAAVAEGGGIGLGNQLLFTDKADQQHFRAVTLGKPVIMGRKTWLSLPERFRPLPGRRNVVLTRDGHFIATDAETAPSLEAAFQRLEDAAEVCVLGGAEVYAQALPLADELVLTHIGKHLPADAFFPAFDATQFVPTQRREASAADGTPLAFVTYRRNTQGA
jgi:dihydrofolate reductase